MNQEEYENLVDMFASKGWKQFISAVTDIEDALTRTSVDSAPQNDDWQYLRGQVHQMRSLIGYENFIKMSWEQQERDKIDDEDIV
jgi:cell division septation protein DedD